MKDSIYLKMNESKLIINITPNLFKILYKNLLDFKSQYGYEIFWDVFREVTIIFITCPIVWSQVNSKEGAQLHPSTENWNKDILSMDPPSSTRLSIPLHQSVPSRSFHKPLILLHQSADALKTTITEN